MPKLIIIRGNSGSGKSSVAKELQKQFSGNSLLLSQDIVRKDMLSEKDGHGTKTAELLELLLRYGHDNFEYTILEGILKAEWYMPLFIKAAEIFADGIYAYYYDIPLEETLKRHTEKKVFKYGIFNKDDLKRWYCEKDYIGLIEEKAITIEISLTDAVSMILKDVGFKK